jgi:hypothetical protein
MRAHENCGTGPRCPDPNCPGGPRRNHDQH